MLIKNKIFKCIVLLSSCISLFSCGGRYGKPKFQIANHTFTIPYCYLAGGDGYMVGTTDYNKEEFIDETLKLNDYLEHKIIFGLDYFSFKDENYYIGLEYKNRSFHFYEPIGFYTSPIYPDIYNYYVLLPAATCCLDVGKADMKMFIDSRELYKTKFSIKEAIEPFESLYYKIEDDGKNLRLFPEQDIEVLVSYTDTSFTVKEMFFYF